MNLDKENLMPSIIKLVQWLDNHNFKGYEPRDALSSKLAPLTFKSLFAERILQQIVLRCPFQIRHLIGVKPRMSTIGMGFLARGYIRMWQATQELIWNKRAIYSLDWLIKNKIGGYSGACWGNNFDYVSRGGRLPKFMPTVVWTSLIGHAFLDGYEAFGDKEYLNIAISSCEFVLKDLIHEHFNDGICLSYTPFKKLSIHNANMLGAGFLARVYSVIKRKELADVARKAMTYSCNCQLPSGAWYYGEAETYHWIDNWHTAYNLDSLRWYIKSAEDEEFLSNLKKGYYFYKSHFFEKDVKPKYYFNKLYLVDIQCASQGIDTLCFFSEDDPEALHLAQKVAKWTINNMQDKNGYFYFRKLRWKTVKIPMLHWGQATMLSALAHLYLKLSKIQ